MASNNPKLKTWIADLHASLDKAMPLNCPACGKPLQTEVLRKGVCPNCRLELIEKSKMTPWYRSRVLYVIVFPLVGLAAIGVLYMFFSGFHTYLRAAYNTSQNRTFLMIAAFIFVSIAFRAAQDALKEGSKLLRLISPQPRNEIKFSLLSGARIALAKGDQQMAARWFCELFAQGFDFEFRESVDEAYSILEKLGTTTFSFREEFEDLLFFERMMVFMHWKEKSDATTSVMFEHFEKKSLHQMASLASDRPRLFALAEMFSGQDNAKLIADEVVSRAPKLAERFGNSRTV